MINKNKTSNALITLLLVMHVISWVLFMPFNQLQMMLFGKRIVSFIHYGIIEIVLIISLLAQNNWKLKINKIERESIILCACFFISFIFNVVRIQNLTPFIIMFYLMFWIFPIFLIIILNQFDYNPKKFLKFMLIIIILHAVIIFYQRYTNSAFWPFLTYDNGEIAFEIDDYYSTDKYAARCVGMTGTGLDAGILLMFGIILLFIIPDLKKKTRMILVIFFCVAIYFSGTRNVYVMVAYILSMMMLMNVNFSKKSKVKVLIAFTIILAIIYCYLISSVITVNTTGELLTDTTSIGIRLEKWGCVIEYFKENSILDLFFGCMKWQNAGNSMIIDNLYLELVYCSGILCMFYYIKYIIELSKVQANSNNYLSLISASFTLSYFIYGVLNSSSNFYFTLIMLLIVFNKNYNKNLDDKLNIKVEKNDIVCRGELNAKK